MGKLTRSGKMATEVASTQGVGVLRLALTGAIAEAVFYVICWVGAFLPLGPATHMYLQLFTSADIRSGAALVQGLCWSMAFGLIGGAVIAWSYNLLGALERK
jgi:hypothetical protein